MAFPQYRTVLTASRRTDLVRWYPEAVFKALATRYPPAKVHSIVIMTKFPSAVLSEDFLAVLRRYDQCIVQATITGWGGTELEPAVPAADEALAFLPALMDFLGRPERLSVRLDPLLGLSDGRDNLEEAHRIMDKAASLGVRSFITSVVTPYAKAVNRLARAGLALAPWSAEERRLKIGALAAAAQSLGVKLQGCCLPELPQAACVDGRLLQELHPEHLPCRLDHPAGQRQNCGCTHAVDLGWYASHPCYSGCLYCYANPRTPPK